MGILDRLRTKPPAKTPRGGSGRNNISGFPEPEELNLDLRHPYGLRKFDEMYRTDPDVRRIVAMTFNPIIGGTWTVEPFGEDEAEEKDVLAADLVRWAIFTNMGPRLPGHLAQALPVLIRSGFAPFEQQWEAAEWNGRKVLVPKTLGLRLPRTIRRFIQDDEGNLTAIEQFLPSNGAVQIPAEDLVYYRLGAEGDNWEGTSLLRAAYKPWYFKDKLERIDAIKQEREAVGVPICYPPRNATANQLEQIEGVLGGIRTAEQGYIIAPGPHAENEENGQGWRFEILSHNAARAGATSDVKASMEYHRDEIAASLIADFMRLGQGQGAVGARATADVQQNPFLAAVEALAAEVESVLDQLVNRITALNFDVDEPPKLRMSLIDSTSLTELADYVQKLVAAGALKPDNELEDWLRDRGDLPPADEDARKEREEMAKKLAENPPVPAPGAPQPPAAPRPAPAPAPQPPAPKPAPPKEKPDAPDEMRWWEQLMCLDEIAASIDSARARFETAGGEPARSLARTLADTAVSGRQFTPKADDALEKAIYGEMARLYRTGRSTVIDELEAQQAGAGEPSTSAQDSEADARKQLMRRARLAAQSIASRIWQKASQTVLAKGGHMPSVQAAAEQEAMAALRAEAQLHAAGVLNQGRQDEAGAREDQIRGARYTSILDRTRCEQCAAADDDVLRPLDDPVRLAHRPPNPDCYGGGRCRCMEFYELIDEDPSSGGGPAPEPPSLQPTPGLGTDAADHFDVEGGTQAMRDLIDDQIAAIESVHRFPRSMARIPLRVTGMDQGVMGSFGWRFSARSQSFAEQWIKLSAGALREDPPIVSAVHEIGHFLDANNLGGPLPLSELVRGEMASDGSQLAGWWSAVSSSSAYDSLVRRDASAYLRSRAELFARSYEQWIRDRSGNTALAAKIAARRAQSGPDIYWDDADFAPIAAQFDALFEARGLFGSVG